MEWKKKRMNSELLEMKAIVIETENEWNGWNRLDTSESTSELVEFTDFTEERGEDAKNVKERVGGIWECPTHV